MKKQLIFITLILFMLTFITACGNQQESAGKQDSAASVSWTSMKKTSSMELSYAQEFSVDYYDEIYPVITIANDGKIIIVPEKAAKPTDLEDGMIVLQQPLDPIYLVSTSSMDYFAKLNSISNISLSGTKENDWYIPEAKEAMKKGEIAYAGKYSAPDYELILSSGCNLAIENTMIYHTPKVKEQLEDLGVPVIVDHSSYEKHPLGRMEWIKLYGVIVGKEEEAKAYYDDLLKKVEPVLNAERSKQTVAFFYITSNGAVSVRKAGDYVAKAIDLSGGNYIFADLDDDSATTTMNMQMEEFFSRAKDVDILIYNSTIDGNLTEMSQLIEKSSLLKEFRAVQSGNVWCTDKNLFQESLGLGNLMIDFHSILENNDIKDEDLNYLHRLK